jgi:hypothetical protein
MTARSSSTTREVSLSRRSNVNVARSSKRSVRGRPVVAPSSQRQPTRLRAAVGKVEPSRRPRRQRWRVVPRLPGVARRARASGRAASVPLGGVRRNLRQGRSTARAGCRRGFRAVPTRAGCGNSVSSAALHFASAMRVSAGTPSNSSASTTADSTSTSTGVRPARARPRLHGGLICLPRPYW